MPRIATIPPAEASGPLKQQYDDAIGRAGRIWNIVGLMSRNPRVLKASMELYGALNAVAVAARSACRGRVGAESMCLLTARPRSRPPC